MRAGDEGILFDITQAALLIDFNALPDMK